MSHLELMLFKAICIAVSIAEPPGQAPVMGRRATMVKGCFEVSSADASWSCVKDIFWSALTNNINNMRQNAVSIVSKVWLILSVGTGEHLCHHLLIFHASSPLVLTPPAQALCNQEATVCSKGMPLHCKKYNWWMRWFTTRCGSCLYL